MNELTILNVKGVRARLDEKGNPELNLEDVSRGLGFIQNKNGVEYIRWETIGGYLYEFGFSQQVGKETFIKENMFYKLCFKARNEIALKFQDKVTDEILPEIRKTGSYSIVPKTYAETLIELGKSLQEKEKLEEANKFLEKTKAWIGEKKIATAMNTASQKSRENKKLQIELDKSREYASIKRIELQLHRKFDWHKLRDFCNDKELEMPKIFDANYGKVRTYPAQAWLEVYDIDLEEIV